MTEPAIYFTTEPHSCDCGAATYVTAFGGSSHRPRCESRCQAAFSEERRGMILGGPRVAVYRAQCTLEHDHELPHVAPTAEGAIRLFMVSDG